MSDHTNPLQSSTHQELVDEVIRLRAEASRTRERIAELERAERMRESTSNAPQRTTTTRKRLPEERVAYTHVFRLRYEHSDGKPDVMQLYFTLGEYDDGRLGEVLIKADRAGTMARGLLDVLGIVFSLALQYGVPLEVLVTKLKGIRFPPDGIVGHPDIHFCTSPVDLLAKYLELKYLPKENP